MRVGKKYVCYCLLVILTMIALRLKLRFFLWLIQCHDSTTRLENTAVTALAQNANGMRNTEIHVAVSRKSR